LDDSAAEFFADAVSASHALSFAADGPSSASAGQATPSNPVTERRPRWQLVSRLHACLCAEAVLLAQGAPPVAACRALLRLSLLPPGPGADVLPGDGSAGQHPEPPPYRPAGGVERGFGGFDLGAAAAAQSSSPAALLDLDLVGR
jgi:hypothetical protein